VRADVCAGPVIGRKKPFDHGSLPTKCRAMKKNAIDVDAPRVVLYKSHPSTTTTQDAADEGFGL
jgi:hypothetical protein